MYNLPYVSYGIFVFILVAIWLLAWKKGFRAALCSFVLTLATVGLIVGISFAIYNHIAPLFSNYIKSHFDGDPSYDFTYFANAARPQVIAICITVGFIPVYAILFGISYPIYRHFKRNDYPRLAKVLGPNSKKVRTSKRKLNKLGAAVTTGVTSVASAGFVATATGVVFTTSGSYNAFNDAMSVLSLGTSYGLTKDSLSLHKMYEFVPMTKDAALMKFSQVIAPNSKTALTQADIDQIKASGNFDKFLKLLADSESEAILNVLASKYSSAAEDIEYDGIDTTLDLTISNKTNLWRPLGNETSKKAVYAFDIAAVEKLYANVKFGIASSEVETIINWIKENGIQKFEDTQASKLLENAYSSKAKIEEELAKAKNDAAIRREIQVKLKNIMDSEKVNIGNTIQTIKNLSDELILKTSSSSSLFRQEPIVTDAMQKLKIAKDNADAAGDTFEAYTGIAKSQTTNQTPSLNGSVRNSLAPYQQAIHNLETANARLSDLDSQIDSKNTLIRGLQQQLDTANNKELPDANNAYNVAAKAVAKVDQEISNIENDLTTINLQAQTIQGQLSASTDQDEKDRLAAELTKLNDKSTAIQKNLDAKRAEKIQKENVRDNQKQNVDQLNNKITVLNKSITTEQGYLATLKSEESIAAREKGTATTEKNKADIEANRQLQNYLAIFNPWKNADNVYDSAIRTMNGFVNEANAIGSKLRSNVQSLKESIKRLKNTAGQNGVILWEVAPGTKVYVGPLDNSTGLELKNMGDFENLPNEIVEFDPNPIDKIKVNGGNALPSVDTSKIITHWDLNIPVSAINLDTNVWGNDAAYQASYEYSIPYLERVEGENNAIQVKQNTAKVNGYDFILKKTTDIDDAGKTEGLIKVLEFNLKNTNDAITKAFIPYKDSQKQVFDKNIEEYLETLRKALGA